MDYVLPTVGSSGFFKLNAPFDKLILNNERYTCQAIRRLSEYLANNENPKDDIYIANGVTAEDYEIDLKEDMYVVSLQALTGHWVYVPARYINSYPAVNGIPYRSVTIGVALPAIPADLDLNFLETKIKDVVKEAVGVDSKTKAMETSRVTLVTKEKHLVIQAQRQALTLGVTDRSKYAQLLTKYQSALQKIAMLENYIETHR